MVIQRICDLQTHPLDVTHLNQMLHLVHEAGVTEDLFRYYFLVSPRSHPYPVEKVEGYSPKFETRAISSLDQLKCGLRRFYIDALLLFGNIRSAFSELRVMDNKHLESFFSLETFDPAKMASRGDIFPLNNIPKDDRYLISEMACKAYSALKPGESVLLKRTLVEEFRKNGRKRIK